MARSNNNDKSKQTYSSSGKKPEIHPDVLDFLINIQTAIAPHPRPLKTDSSTIVSQISSGEYIPPLSVLSLARTKYTGAGSVIAILDTGVYDKHTDLKGQVIYKTSYAGDESNDTEDAYGHGTHLSGIIAGKNSGNITGLKGIAPDAKIVSVKITDGDAGETAWYKAADGLEQVLHYNASKKNKQKITIVLLAFNAFDNVNTKTCTCHHRLSKLIKALYMQNIPVIVSAGNSYLKFRKEGLAYPAHVDHVIAVGAAENNYMNAGVRKPAYFAQCVSQDTGKFNNTFICAPGGKTFSCGIDSPSAYTKLEGSSQAAAVVAGVIALMQQRYRNTKDPRSLPSVHQLCRILLDQSETGAVNTGRADIQGKNIRYINGGKCLLSKIKVPQYAGV